MKAEGEEVNYLVLIMCQHRTGGRRGLTMEGLVGDTLKKPGMTNRDVLAVINPHIADRNRSALVQDNPRMPSHEEWRLTGNVGHRLDPEHVIRSNHFLVNTDRLPSQFYQYDIQLRKYGQGRVLSDDNFSHTEDTRNTRTLIASLWALHLDWPRAFSYDDRSTLFTCQALVLNGSSGVGSSLVEDVCLPNQHGAPSSRRYQVTLTLTRDIITPVDLMGWQRAGADVLRAANSALLNFARRLIIMDRPEWFVVGGRGFTQRVQFGSQDQSCGGYGRVHLSARRALVVYRRGDVWLSIYGAACKNVQRPGPTPPPTGRHQ